MTSAKTMEKIGTEGAKIYCEKQGSGPLLIFITGALGDAGYYSSASDFLSKEFTVVTYDRRCNSRSTGDRTLDMSIEQQTRDVVAIISKMGFSSAIVFGNSGGGIIALELAALRPDLISFLIVHEVPIIEILPDPKKWRSFNNDIYIKSQKEGWKVALVDFMNSLVNSPNISFPIDLKRRVSGNVEFFFQHEFKSFVDYIPDFKRLQENDVDMVAAVGIESNDAYYVQSTKEMALKLGCACVKFPGQHIASFYVPEEFSNAVKNIINRKDQKKH